MGKKFPKIIEEMNNQWPGEKPLKIMFQYEARFGLISDIRRCWCPKPTRPLCSATVSQEYIYAAVSVEDGSIDTLYHMLTLIVCRFSLMSSHIGIPTTE
ncbi:MAG: hypothetical protein HQK88_06015 [Nitrospirae bacterium]|nr:hypothetical protein [Nitrospirota bacterium]